MVDTKGKTSELPDSALENCEGGELELELRLNINLCVVSLALHQSCSSIAFIMRINGNLCKVIPGALILRTVLIKLIAPKIEEIPDKCKLKIARSTDPPEWDWIPANGG